MSCQDCGATLTLGEAYYYETRCEACERAWTERLTAWRNGEASEPELDRFFSASTAPTDAAAPSPWSEAAQVGDEPFRDEKNHDQGER